MRHLHWWIALAALPPAVVVLTFIGWAPAPAGFVIAAAAAMAWCRWVDRHLPG